MNQDMLWWLSEQCSWTHTTQFKRLPVSVIGICSHRRTSCRMNRQHQLTRHLQLWRCQCLKLTNRSCLADVLRLALQQVYRTPVCDRGLLDTVTCT